ncbi:MAG TPA: hypothetical protein VMI72_10700 [Roseiarcus sp.]|nr:hypothetical protein [Roseiarcus sp.]
MKSGYGPGETKVEPRAQGVEQTNALAQRIDALGAATEALLRRLGKEQPATPAKTRAVKSKAAAPRKRAASKPSAAKRAVPKDAPAPAKRTRAAEAARPASGRNRRKGSTPARSEP